MSSCVPFVFPWASLAHLLALGFFSLFTNFVFPWAFTDFIGLSQPNYFILILEVYGPAAVHSYFFSHHTLPMGLLLTTSLFSGSFEPICFHKAHLLISWTCDPLFLPLGLNGFCSLSFVNFSMLLGWASFLTFGFHKKKTLNRFLEVKSFQKFCISNLYFLKFFKSIFVSLKEKFWLLNKEILRILNKFWMSKSHLKDDF